MISIRRVASSFTTRFYSFDATRFVIYPGSSHGVGPLKQRLGRLRHNRQWFLEHIWDERVEMPLEPPPKP